MERNVFVISRPSGNHELNPHCNPGRPSRHIPGLMERRANSYPIPAPDLGNSGIRGTFSNAQSTFFSTPSSPNLTHGGAYHEDFENLINEMGHQTSLSSTVSSTFVTSFS